MKKTRKGTNPNASNEIILEQIEKYGPVSAKAIASALGIPEKRAMQSASYMRNKKKINIQKQGTRLNRQYFYDPDFPLIGAPAMSYQADVDDKEPTKEQEDSLFEELVGGSEQLAPMKSEKSPRGLDKLVNRCHHLVLALEHCSSNKIMDSFNLNEEQARILMNKVVSRFSGLNVSFCINVKKEKSKP